jgi:hypothetical protein
MFQLEHQTAFAALGCKGRQMTQAEHGTAGFAEQKLWTRPGWNVRCPACPNARGATQATRLHALPWTASRLPVQLKTLS